MSNFAVSDLHGCYNQWKQIQSFCKDSDRIFVLGDCIDRSPEGFKVLKSVLNDTRSTLLCGNHEDMMLQALIAEKDFGCCDDVDFWRWFNNGGQDTYNSWQEDGSNFDWITILQNLPTWAKYINQEGREIIMTHSGATPKPNFSFSSLTRKALLWDRECLRELHWHRSEKEILIHGHTPIPLMPQFKNRSVEVEPGAFWYCDEHKCNIDNGGIWTGCICLLDLDTWEEHIFYG